MSPGAISIRDNSNFGLVLDEPGKPVSITRSYQAASPGGPAMVRGWARFEKNCDSSMKKGMPPKWSAWKWVTKIVLMALKSIPSRFSPITDEAPQSIRKLLCSPVRWKQVLSRPPLPKASPQPTNCRRIVCLRNQASVKQLAMQGDICVTVKFSSRFAVKYQV